MSYYQDWYKNNKKTLSERKKKKYATDAAYRESVKQRTHEFYHTNLKRPVKKSRQIIQDDQGNKYVTIGKVATVINRAISSIRAYHRRGLIPEPSTFDGRGWRLYTRDQAELLYRVFREIDSGRVKTVAKAAPTIQEEWRRLEDGQNRQVAQAGGQRRRRRIDR